MPLLSGLFVELSRSITRIALCCGNSLLGLNLIKDDSLGRSEREAMVYLAVADRLCSCIQSG